MLSTQLTFDLCEPLDSLIMNLSFLPKSFEEEALQLQAIAAGSTGCDEFMPRPTGEVARSCVGQLQIQI